MDEETLKELRSAADCVGLSQEFAELEALAAQPAAEDSAHGHCAAWLRIFTHKHGRDPFPQEVWDAAQPASSQAGSLLARVAQIDSTLWAKDLVNELVSFACLQEREPSDENHDKYCAARDAVISAILAQPAASGEEPPYAYEVPDENGAHLSFAAWFHKYGHELPDDAIPLFLHAAHPPVAPAASGEAPIDMVLHCPECGLQHIDEPEGEGDDEATVRRLGVWANPPHRSHLCHGCGHIWRPADVPTNGVAAVKTAGKSDSQIAAYPPVAQLTDATERCAQIARRWGETHEPHITVNARNAAEKIARAIESELRATQPKGKT